MSNGLWRTRWAAVGAAVAVTLGAGGLFTASAAVSSGERTVYVPITPCRIMDTRPGQENRGPRSTPIGADETHTIQVRGTNGDCTIPADAVGVVMNVTSLNSTSGSFLTVFPADVTRPGASSLNWSPGQAATPNSVTSKLAADGRLSFYNLAGSVDVITDVVGYYADHNHDDRYYTEQEVDAALAGKVDERPTGSVGSLLVGPIEFIPDDDTYDFFYSFSGSLAFEPPSNGCFAAPVALPNGVTVTALSFRAISSAASDISLRLSRDPEGQPASTTMAFVSSGPGGGSEQTVETSVINDALIDTAANAYFLGLCMSDASAFYSARISYTNP